MSLVAMSNYGRNTDSHLVGGKFRKISLANGHHEHQMVPRMWHPNGSATPATVDLIHDPCRCGRQPLWHRSKTCVPHVVTFGRVSVPMPPDPQRGSEEGPASSSLHPFLAILFLACNVSHKLSRTLG